MLLVRHAQSEWNLHFGRSRIDPGLPDPSLTAEGVRQAELACATLAAQGITRLLCSPYRRAIQTASIFAAALGLPGVGIEPLVRERCAFSCDQGSLPSALAAEWPHLDFSGLDDIWWGGLIESHDSLADRCERFRAKVAGMADRDRVAVVSHWGFIRGLTGQELGNAAFVRLG